MARDFIEQVVRRLPKEMKATGAQDFEAGDIVALPFDTPEEEARLHRARRARRCGAWRSARARVSAGSPGPTWRCCCAACGAMAERSPTRSHAAGVPYVITGMDNLFGKPEAEAARQLFYFLAEPD